MRRKACALLLTAALGGCTSMDHADMGPACSGSWGRQQGPPNVPGLAGPNGQGVPMAAPYNMAPPVNPYAAQQMMANSVPLGMVQINRGGNVPGMGGVPGGNMPMTPIPSGGLLTPPGVPFAPGIPAGPNVTQTGFMPDADSGVIPANVPPGAAMGGIMLAQHGAPAGGPGGGIRFAAQRTQIRFTRPTGMKVAWFAQGPDGRPMFSNVPLEAPARYNFAQGAIYKLKISGIEGRPGLEVYPTMEVVPANPKTEAFLAHSSVPVEFTQDDFKQIAEGNYVTKVIYLPDPNFQDVAGSGTEEIISTRLEPGADPIHEALRRGSILVIIRMGNVDEEAPNTPPLTMPAPGGPPPAGARPPNAPHIMVPYPGYMPHTSAVPPGANPLIPPANLNPSQPNVGAVLPPLPPSTDLKPGTLIPPPAPPTPVRTDAKKAPAASPLIPPPAVPTVDGKQTIDIGVPPALPAATPGATGKQADLSIPPLPTLPSAKTTDALPTIPPASAPSLPTSPEIIGPPALPAFPATPGTIRPSDQPGIAPTSLPTPPSNNGAKQID